MNPRDIYRVLKRIRANKLYHANTVPTSCTFLEKGALLSRGFVADNGLFQTPQMTDDIDKQFDIWYDVFLDHVDIHYRAGGVNHYGPVLFELDVNILLELPPGSDIRVTKSNPKYWPTTGAEWFSTTLELQATLQFGDFDKMLVIRTPDHFLRFPQSRATIYLDNPQRPLSHGVDAYDHAVHRLTEAAKRGSVEVTIRPHECKDSCKCVAKYESFSTKVLNTRFS